MARKSSPKALNPALLGVAPGALLVFHSRVRVNLHLVRRAADVDRWRRGNISATVVKSNHGRSVWLVPAGSPGLYVKSFPPELLRDRAQKEAGLLHALEKAGIPCPPLVAVARDAKGSYLVTEEIPDARTLGSLLQEPGPHARPLLDALGKLAKQLHDHGFDHQDFHAGNVLVRDGRLYVIYVHRARRQKSLSRIVRHEALAFMAMSFVEHRPLGDVVRFLRAYGLADRADWLDVWDRLRVRHHKYYEGRQQRCFKDGTGFGVLGKLHFRKGVDLDAIQTQVQTGPRVAVRETRTESLYRVDETLFAKTTTPARARKIWENAHGLAIRGIDTPKLWTWDRTTVTGEWIDSLDIHEYILGTFGGLPRADRNHFLFRLARLVRRMHDHGAYHGDLKAGNVLVGEGRIAIIDLDRVRFSFDVVEKDRLFNLAQLNAAVTPPLTRTDRLRFLDYYIGRCATLRARRGDWVPAIMAATVARKHRWPSVDKSRASVSQ